MMCAGVPCFFGLGLEDGHAPTFKLLLSSFTFAEFEAIPVLKTSSFFVDA